MTANYLVTPALFYHIQSHEIIEMLDMQRDEQTPLLRSKISKNYWKCIRQCSVSSKPVLLILIWNLLASLAVAFFTSPDFYASITSSSSTNFIKVFTFGLSGFLLLFYPLATCLADQKWGRYKIIVNSLYCLLCTATIMCAFGGALIAILVKCVGSQILYISLGVPILVAFLLSLLSLITFKANVIQFGTDHLLDYSSDQNSLYIHWYVWSSYAGIAILQIMLSFSLTMIAQQLTKLFILVPIFATSILGVTLVIQCCKHNWFNAYHTEFNPYKLIYQVINYAIKLKQRSAYTYDDDVPARLDFGKERYGGPFTTEQVEDVKTFLKILRLLLALGPIFAVDIAASNQLPTVAYHLADDFGTALLLPLKESCSIVYSTILVLNGSITPLIITLVLPLYVSLLRPHMDRCFPRLLKQIGLGMILILLSLITSLLLDTIRHIHSSSTTCFLSDDHYLNNATCHVMETSPVSPLYIMIPYTLNAFAYMLLYIGIYKFILFQSSDRMRGLVIGSFFAIKGVFQLLAVLTVYLPFISWSSDSSFPSCGFVYYLINIAIALITIMAYICAARSYKYPTRGSPMLARDMERIIEVYYKTEHDSGSQLEKQVKSLTITVQETKPDNTKGTTNTEAKLELPDHISSRD